MAACSQHTMQLWLLITVCLTLAHSVALDVPGDTKPELKVCNTSYLSVKGTTDHFRNSPSVMQTIQLLFVPLEHGSTGNVNGGSMHKEASYNLNNESDTAFPSGNELRVIGDTNKQTHVSVDTVAEVLATLDSSGVRPSSYLIKTAADFYIAGSIKTISDPRIELNMFSFDEKTFGSYFVQILYFNNTADVNMSAWKSQKLTFTSEASLPKQVPGCTMTTGKGIEVVCSYRPRHGETILQMSIFLKVLVLSRWEKEKDIFCHGGFICRTRSVNASHLSLYVHPYLDDSLANASDLKCLVEIEKNGSRMQKFSENEKKPNQNEQNTHKAGKEVDQVTHKRSGDGLSAAEIAGIAVPTIFIICLFGTLVVWKMRRTQSWSTGHSAPHNTSNIEDLPSQAQSIAKTSPDAAESGTDAVEPLLHTVGLPGPATLDCSGSSEAASATLLDNKVAIRTKRESPSDSDGNSAEAVSEEIPCSIRRSLVIFDSTSSNSIPHHTVVETEFGIVAEDEM